MQNDKFELHAELIVRVGDELFANAKRIELLRQIDRLGNLTHAAKVAGYSYKGAWDSIDQMASVSGGTLITRRAGGKGGGRGKVAAAGSRKKPKNARFPWLPKVPARSQERPEPCHPEGRRLVWFAGRESLRRWDISHYRLRRSCPQTSEISRLLRLPRPAS